MFSYSFYNFLLSYWAVFHARTFGFLESCSPVEICSLECKNDNVDNSNNNSNYDNNNNIKPVNGVVGLVFACHLGGASSILGHSIEGSEVCISGDRSSLSTWFESHVKLLVPLLNNRWFHAT